MISCSGWIAGAQTGVGSRGNAGNAAVQGWSNVLKPASLFAEEYDDAGLQKVFADRRMQPDVNPMPCDGKRMIFGGFEVIVGP